MGHVPSCNQLALSPPDTTQSLPISSVPKSRQLVTDLLRMAHQDTPSNGAGCIVLLARENLTMSSSDKTSTMISAVIPPLFDTYTRQGMTFPLNLYAGPNEYAFPSSALASNTTSPLASLVNSTYRPFFLEKKTCFGNQSVFSCF